jgi:hypothetical protein
VFGWVEPGETLSPDILNRVGRIFRGSRRVGGVIVRNEGTPQSAGLETECSFDCLHDKDANFSGKFFVRRECFWAAVKIFAGTDFDCNDWAVAMNTARFHQVKLIAGGYHRISGGSVYGDEEQSRNIRARVDASIWPIERFRRSIRKRTRSYFRQVAGVSREFVTRISRRAIGVSTEGTRPGIDCYVPPPWVKDLVGFSPGESIVLLGCYRKPLAGQAQEIRSVYLDRTTGILVLRGGGSGEASPYQTSPYHDYSGRSGIVTLDASPEMEGQAEKLARGSEFLFQKMPELAHGCFDDHLRISISSARHELTHEINISGPGVAGPRLSES